MEGFVYCWTDKLTSMLYVGSHKGCENDGYICSSEYMLPEYYKRPQDFSRQIVAIGSWTEMRVLEYTILKSANAATDPMFYNQTNGASNFYSIIKKPFTESHKQKLKDKRKGRPISKEHAEKLHAGRRNSKNSEKHNNILAKLRRERVITQESIDKARNTLYKNNTPEQLSERGRKGAVQSLEMRPENYSEIHSARMKLWWKFRKESK